MNIWASIEELESKNILKPEDKRGASCQFDETNNISAKAEEEILEQYKKLSPKAIELVVQSDDYVKDSLDVSNDGEFTWINSSGELCIYSPRMRADLRNLDLRIVDEESLKNEDTTKKCVFLIAPWYSSDSSFSDQYINEGESLSKVLNGDLIIYKNLNATVDTIAKALLNGDIVIFDSHGISYNNTSYICLKNNKGITQDDYYGKHAINGGNWYGVDGTAIAKRIGDNEIRCQLLWMAMCEGMKASGKCGMAKPLHDKGLDVAYGYSQSVSFTGDYLYEESFFEKIKEGCSVKEAFDYMTNKHGIHDPAYTNTQSAYPIIISDEDSFPANVDSHQDVKSIWKKSNIYKDSEDTVAGLDNQQIENEYNKRMFKFYNSTKAGKNVYKLYINDKYMGYLHINKNCNEEFKNSFSDLIQ